MMRALPCSFTFSFFSVFYINQKDKHEIQAIGLTI